MESFKPADYVKWFRNTSPYINAHRSKTFVIAFPGEAINHPNFHNLVHDFALLDSLDIKLVLVHGARQQITEQLQKAGRNSNFALERRITDLADMAAVQEAVGKLRIQIEALLSMGATNSPMHRAAIQVCSGNFITAKPFGVRDGVDFQRTGEVRRVRTEAIRALLQHDIITLLSPVGYSPTGEAFNLMWEEVAEAASIALQADKLIILTDDVGFHNDDGTLCREMTSAQAKQLLEDGTLDSDQQRLIHSALRAVSDGVSRAHLISYQQDGALLQELFTRDGSGTLLTDSSFERLRTATIDDVGGIIELIAPLERDGILVRRSRELLEAEIGHFCVITRDNSIVGCAALYPYPENNVGELACVAVHPDYRHGLRGDGLLDFVERQALRLGINQLFVLTTRTAHWFQERGFIESEVEALPQPKQSLYNYQRRSKVFVKSLI
ncbi:GCN5-related N-acetyltransferase aspartokinase superfamily [gamma proteobacterium HdN1]|nr:GCN5-related N-acetyltransferase aspartokinase superfamily [gamma proteobacterium HdN1]